VIPCAFPWTPWLMASQWIFAALGCGAQDDSARFSARSQPG
jgi:hypothetical protein